MFKRGSENAWEECLKGRGGNLEFEIPNQMPTKAELLLLPFSQRLSSAL